jgi:hypothetical protein
VGVFFPDATWVIADLSRMLRMHGHAVRATELLRSHTAGREPYADIFGYLLTPQGCKRKAHFTPLSARMERFSFPNLAGSSGADFNALRAACVHYSTPETGRRPLL